MADEAEKEVGEVNMNSSICDDEVKIVYKNHKPLGIRDASGFLFFFSDIQQYQGQDERYRLEIEQQFRLADYLLSRLLMVRELTPPTPATEYQTAVVKEVKPETHSVDSMQAGFVNYSFEGRDAETAFERKRFEQWYAENAFDYEKNPIGSRECGLQWAGWIARADQPKPVPTAWRSKEQYSPDVGSWYEYYDAFREVNDTTGLTPLYE